MLNQFFVGPSMQNFKDSYALLSKVKACKMVNNKAELTSELLDILKNDERRIHRWVRPLCR